MTRASRSHDKAVVELLRKDPVFAEEYLSAAMDEADQPGGREALLAVLRHVTKAQGLATTAECAGIPRESLYRALSPKGNLTIKTFLAVVGTTGFKLAAPSKIARFLDPPWGHFAWLGFVRARSDRAENRKSSICAVEIV